MHGQRFSKCPIISSALLIIVGLAGSAAEDEVKCFCDKLNCPGSLVCTGKFCVIGVRDEGGNGRLDQMCGYDDFERPAECAQSWNKWTEVCACTEPLCNTFAYLRSRIDRRNDPDPLQSSVAYDSNYEGVRPSRRGWYHGNSLIVLLVIIPLSVGALAVCLIFLNYHCKMA